VRTYYYPLSLFVLAACVPQQNAALDLANDLKNNVYHTTTKVKEWAMTPPMDERAPQPIQDSYCYYTLQDILCYRQPMPGWEYRLVGYQGTDAAPPAPAVMQPLPLQAEETSALPVNRVANAKPVFVTPPPEVKETQKEGTDTTAGTPATPDITHQQLPNPALAPQL